jgi:preprotein translocase subunit SecG
MSTLLIVQIFITLALIGVILLQRSEGGALGMGAAIVQACLQLVVQQTCLRVLHLY